MRWLPTFILGYLALGIQSGIIAFVGIGANSGVQPNFVILAAVFIALNAPRQHAWIGCFLLGAMHDLATQQTFGIFAFSYGLTAMAVNGASQAIYRQHILTHIACAGLAGIITVIVQFAHAWLHPSERALGLVAHFEGAIYTAALAPIVIGILQRIRGVFGFQNTRKKIRAW